MIIFAAICAAAATFVGIYTLVTPGGRSQVPNRLSKFDRSATIGREELLAEPFSARVGIPVLERVRKLLASVLPSTVVQSLERRLLIAGEPISLHAFLTASVFAAGLGLLVAVVGLAGGGGVLRMAGVVAVALVIALLPLYWLRMRIRTRRNAILKALPDAVDLIVTTVEAGLAIDAALAEVGHETRGPLGEELRLTVRETTLGRSRRDALQRLVERTQVPELRTFVQAIVQAEQTGIPIGQVLRTQAAQIRLKKRQRAEAEAQRAPVKMVVVLAVLVLPAMLLLVIGPALIRMSQDI